MEELAWCAYHARQMDRAVALADRAAGHVAAGPGRASSSAGCRTRGATSPVPSTTSSRLSSSGDAAVTGRALSYLGTALAQSDRFEEATDVLDRAAAMCRAAGLLRPMFNAAFFAGIVRGGRRPRRCARDGDAAPGGCRSVRARGLPAPGAQPAVLALARAGRSLPGSTTRSRHSRRRCSRTATSRASRPRTPGSSWRRPRSISVTTPRPGGGSPSSRRWVEPVAFGWRIDLHRLDVQARLDPSCADEMLERARSRVGEVPVARPRPSRSSRRGGRWPQRRDPTFSLPTSRRCGDGRRRSAGGPPSPELREAFMRRGACTARR